MEISQRKKYLTVNNIFIRILYEIIFLFLFQFCGIFLIIGNIYHFMWGGVLLSCHFLFMIIWKIYKPHSYRWFCLNMMFTFFILFFLCVDTIFSLLFVFNMKGLIFIFLITIVYLIIFEFKKNLQLRKKFIIWSVNTGRIDIMNNIGYISRTSINGPSFSIDKKITNNMHIYISFAVIFNSFLFSVTRKLENNEVLKNINIVFLIFIMAYIFTLLVKALVISIIYFIEIISYEEKNNISFDTEWKQI